MQPSLLSLKGSVGCGRTDWDTERANALAKQLLDDEATDGMADENEILVRRRSVAHGVNRRGE